jgi:hypothetical protein
MKGQRKPITKIYCIRIILRFTELNTSQAYNLGK